MGAGRMSGAGATHRSQRLPPVARRTAVVKWSAFVILLIVVVVLTGVATLLALIWLGTAEMLHALAQFALGRL